MGYDIDPEALSLARYHAEQAGVAEDIHWQERPFTELRAKAEYGCIVTNPPYGERMGDDAEIEALYQIVSARAAAVADVVALYSFVAARSGSAGRPAGRPAAQALQRAARMHVLSVSWSAAAARPEQRLTRADRRRRWTMRMQSRAC